MQSINITRAREKLPKIMEDVYFKDKTFQITRRGIPMIKITKADQTTVKSKKVVKKDIEKAIKLARSIKWIWDDDKWKDKTTEEIAELLAERAWNSHAS